MKYPYLNYIKGLILRGYQSSAIMDRLKAFRFNPPDELEIEQIREDLLSHFKESELKYIAPGPNFSLSTFVSSAQATLDSLELNEIVKVLTGNKSPEWDEAMLIITDPEIRIPVMCLSIQKEDISEIIRIVEEKTGLTLTNDGMNLFFKYFWKIDDMSKLELYHFLSTGILSKHKALMLKAFHKRDGEVDWKIRGKNSTSMENILVTVMNECFVKFKNEIDSDDAESINKVQKWADMAVKAAEKLNISKGEDSSDIIAQLEVNLKTLASTDIQSIDNADMGEIV